MYELMHRWSDGYGASLTFTFIADLPMQDPAAFVTFESNEAVDVFANAADLRAIAAAALAMADAIEGSEANA